MIRFNHFNFNVLDLEKSLKFYKDALDLEIIREHESEGFKLVFIGNKESDFCLELTYLKDRKEAYNLGELEYHLAFSTDDYDGFYKNHKDMGIICYENVNMGIYFISDPDGYWIEIIPEKTSR